MSSARNITLLILTFSLLTFPLAASTAGAQIESRVVVAEVYCNDALIALAYVKTSPQGLQVSAYPPVALCASRLVNVPLLVQFLLLHGEKMERDGIIVYRQVVPIEGELVKVELVAKSIPRGAKLLPLFEAVAVAVLLGAVYSWANRHSVEVL